MEDHLERQIDQLGRVLGKILSDLTGLKGRGRAANGLELVNQTVKGELDVDMQQLLDLPSERFIDVLKTKMRFNDEHLEKLADILLLIADDSRLIEKKQLYEKCLAVYKYLERTESSFSFERQWKINRIRRSIFDNEFL